MMPSVFFFKKATKKAYSLVIRAMTRVHSLYHPFVFREKDEKLTRFLMFEVRDVCDKGQKCDISPNLPLGSLEMFICE